jgi:hypothetical protein
VPKLRKLPINLLALRNQFLDGLIPQWLKLGEEITHPIGCRVFLTGIFRSHD